MNPLHAIKRLVRWVYRSAITGRFVSKEYAERNPETTVRERGKNN